MTARFKASVDRLCAGSGVDTIKKGWASNKWPEPVIRELYEPEQVELTLYLGSAENYQETTQKTTQKTTTKDKILNLVRENPKITTDEMAEIIGITRDGINYHLKKMRGVSLERRDGDNGGHWEIIKSSP